MARKPLSNRRSSNMSFQAYVIYIWRSVWPIARQVLGWFFIFLGIIGLFLPLLQGVLFIVIGIALVGRRNWLLRRSSPQTTIAALGQPPHTLFRLPWSPRYARPTTPLDATSSLSDSLESTSSTPSHSKAPKDLAQTSALPYALLRPHATHTPISYLLYSDCCDEVLPQKERPWRVRLRLPPSRPTNEACSCVRRKISPKPAIAPNFIYIRLCRRPTTQSEQPDLVQQIS
jgi:hypothetical protein